jgi:hypothetical protein
MRERSPRRMIVPDQEEMATLQRPLAHRDVAGAERRWRRPVTAGPIATAATPSASPKLQLQLYFSDEFTEVKLPLRVVPMLLTAAMITKAIPVAIRQYSMAVAPD